MGDYFFCSYDRLVTFGGRMHSDAQLTLFSSFSLGKTSKFLLRSLVRRFQHTPQMMGFLGIGNNPMVGAPKRQGCPTCWAIAVDIAGALSK